MEGLAIKKDGIYVDCTAGGGGHSSGILERLGRSGRLISLDKDDEALATCERKREALEGKERWVLVKSDFSKIDEVLERLNIEKIDGVLADLGVSSHQIDTAERGFSFRFEDAPLDMNPRLRYLLPPGEAKWRLDLTTEQMRITKENVTSTMIFGKDEWDNTLFRFILPDAGKEPPRDGFYDNMWRSSTELFYVMKKIN